MIKKFILMAIFQRHSIQFVFTNRCFILVLILLSNLFWKQRNFYDKYYKPKTNECACSRAIPCRTAVKKK